jgi:hypothetical protein
MCKINGTQTLRYATSFIVATNAMLSDYQNNELFATENAYS